MNYTFVNIIESGKTSGDIGFYRIPGANQVSYRLKEGAVNIQQWDLEGYRIQYIQSKLNERIVFELRYQGLAELLVCCFKTKLEINSFSNPVVRLNPEYAHLYSQINFQAFCMLKNSRHKSALLLVTHKLTESSTEIRPGNKSPHPFLLEARMMEMVEKMIHTSYVEPKPFHLGQVLELMTAAKAMVVMKRNTEHFDESHLSGIYVVKDWLDKNIERKYSEVLMVQKAGMNVKKLNIGFENLFGFTPFHYLRVRRLQIAHEKIADTQINLKIIARNACYRNYSNFSSAFRKHFGYSPVSLRKREGS